MLELLNKFAEESWHKRMYIFIHYTFYALFAVTFMGVTIIKPEYLAMLNMIIRYYVSLFLIIRFNPWIHTTKSPKIRRFDQQIAFTSGIFVFLTTAAAAIVKKYTEDTVNQVKAIAHL